MKRPMPVPWIAAWTAWALRVAEALARPRGPVEPAATRVAPPRREALARDHAANAPAPKRRGRRHG